MPEGINTGKIVLLQNGQELLFSGTAVKCIKAPGHTNGSMAYLVDGKYLFTGDAFKVRNGAMRVHPYTMDAELAIRTMEQLKETISGSSLILTSHYGYFERLKLK
jgi:glyoxylase-like metal-dependent hydrolase (beta-lactamase superfamily II)